MQRALAGGGVDARVKSGYKGGIIKERGPTISGLNPGGVQGEMERAWLFRGISLCLEWGGG